nr:hypothetical protein [uncultured bacterium]
MKNLSEWLALLELRHPSSIELGLDRVASVYQRLGNHSPAARVITVAGTNGKGSTVSYVDAIARAAGWRCGRYTSPHLLAFNERIVIDGVSVPDQDLCAAFEEIEAALDATSLSYFEFTTLAALLLFSRADLDLAVLEVGLGGRLDAVNIVDADVSIITSVGMDHMDWLGDDRDSIGREKAGVMRPQRTAVCAERDPPDSLLTHAKHVSARLCRLGVDFDWRDTGSGLQVHFPGGVQHCPYPPMPGSAQRDNLAAACVSLHALSAPPDFGRADLEFALRQAALAGRFQKIQSNPDVFLDVAHNIQAASQLRASIEAQACRGTTWLVMAMLADKEVEQVAECLDRVANRWWISGLQGPRGITAEKTLQRLAGRLQNPVDSSPTLKEAFSAVLAAMGEDDQLIIFGSFLTVAEAIRFWNR